MEEESLKADPQKRKRHWFQFSLRTLMIAVILFAVLALVRIPPAFRRARESGPRQPGQNPTEQR